MSFSKNDGYTKGETRTIFKYLNDYAKSNADKTIQWKNAWQRRYEVQNSMAYSADRYRSLTEERRQD